MAAAAAFLPSIIGAVASVALTSLLKKDEPPPQSQSPAAAAAAPAPEVEEPTPMPTVNDAERRAASRRSIATQRARMGRASTVLTNDDDRLGG